MDEIARAELIEREPCPRCGAPPGSVCRANSGVVAVDYHTGRYAKIPMLKSGPAIRIPAARGPGRTWQPGPPKYDGHRTVLRRTDETVVLYARSGRVVTQHWMDLAVAGMGLRPGTVLDGEAVIWRDGRLDFAAAQSRAASSTTWARALATRYPASCICWDVPCSTRTRRSVTADACRTPSAAPSSWSSSPMSGRRSRPPRPPTTGTSPCSGTTPCVNRASRESSVNAAARAIRRQDRASG
ncbi:hypothetical protein ABZ622_39570 [Streptomyces sp. NPDC007164]|uniref:zinc finger domain-containing protein n=1 Tax=Streptomyces sp. NPDC007164 TaxID=3156918 RepID=UPI0033F22C4C